MPTALAVAADGAIYVSDAANSRVRRVAPDGTITTVLGTGAGSGLGGAGFAGDGGPSSQGKAFSAMGLQLNRAGQLYVSDSGNNRVRIVRDGIVTTLAGSGASGFGGDGAAGAAAMLNTPHKIAAAADGRVFIADRANGRVRVIDANGSIRTVAGGDARAARLPANHAPIARPDRPERAINDVTASVAAALPPAPGATPLAERTLIDRHLFASWARDKVPHAAPANDFEFARRVFLDLTGRIPATERLASFVRSTAHDKRDRLIDELLDSPAWADFWTYWYGDLLRVTHNRVGKRLDETFRCVAAAVVPRRQAVQPPGHRTAHGVGARLQLAARCRPRRRSSPAGTSPARRCTRISTRTRRTKSSSSRPVSSSA
jgi:sugar lactone lactonase YvrE